MRLLTDIRTYGLAATLVAFCGFVYLLGNTDPVAVLLDWMVGSFLVIITALIYIKPSIFEFENEIDYSYKRPTIQYLIAEGFISLIPSDNDFTYSVKVDTSKCPWKVEVTYLNNYTEIHYLDDPAEAYIFDNKIIDRK